MRKLFVLFAVVAMCLSGPAASRQPTVHVIKQDDGGMLTHFIARYDRWEENGDKVRIDGECLSACTLMLGILPLRDICATDRAQFGFHSATNQGHYADDGTAFMWFFYSGRVREVLAQHGWPAPSFRPNFLMIKAQEIVRACG